MRSDALSKFGSKNFSTVICVFAQNLAEPFFHLKLQAIKIYFQTHCSFLAHSARWRCMKRPKRLSVFRFLSCCHNSNSSIAFARDLVRRHSFVNRGPDHCHSNYCWIDSVNSSCSMKGTAPTIQTSTIPRIFTNGKRINSTFQS